MGFDLYGLKPHNPKKLVKPEIDWASEPTEEEKEKFFADLDHYEKNVPGHYFRNNVWWWRPLWDYINDGTNLGLSILTDEQLDEGRSNSGVEISEDQAIKLAIELHKQIDSGEVKEHEEYYMQQFKLAEEENKELEAMCKEIHEGVVEQTGNKDIAPIDYPEDVKKLWDAIWKKKNWTANYPFSEDNVRDFANFCYQSGGFQIW